MKISLRNIGKIQEADVELNGITVIAGENDTGKSTVGKALFATVNGMCNVKEQIKSEKISSVENYIDDLFFDSFQMFFSPDWMGFIAQHIIDGHENAKNINALMLFAVQLCNEKFGCEIESPAISEKQAQRLNEILTIENDSILRILLTRLFQNEFNSQVNNIISGEPGEITLSIKNRPIKFLITNNRVQEVNFDIEIQSESIYIDDPFIVDEVRNRTAIGKPRLNNKHVNHLISVLREINKPSAINQILIENKFDTIFKEIGFDINKNVFETHNPSTIIKGAKADNPLNIKNLSTGLKSFLIIQTLLTNETLKPGGIIILDEPEIHLHPEWQLKYAELVVLLQKEFNMHILLNTHSPYFLWAIQTYSSKHGIADKCKYYLSDLVGEDAYIKDVTDNTEAIYTKLSRPFQSLEDEEWSDD